MTLLLNLQQVIYEYYYVIVKVTKHNYKVKNLYPRVSAKSKVRFGYEGNFDVLESE